MKQFLIALVSGIKLTSALYEGQTFFCCYGDISKKFPQGDVKIWSQGDENHCTTFELLSNSYENISKDLKCNNFFNDLLDSEPSSTLLTRRSTPNGLSFFQSYQTYNEMKRVLKGLGNIPGGSFNESIGKTNENRDIFAFKISSNSPSPCGRKQSIWINGGIHAREWISPASVIFIITNMLLNYNNDEVKDLLERYNFHFTPLANPDGYEYSLNNPDKRGWRKNLKKSGNTIYGVDLNRNWDDHWGFGRSSDKYYSDTFKGFYKNSEPEVQALAEYALSIPNRFASLDIHSFGQKILRNWGWTKDAPKNDAKLKEIANSIINAFAKHNYTYTTERAGEFYIAGGALDDWMASKANFTSFTIELSPEITEERIRNQSKGFQPDPKNIVPVGASLYDAVLAYATYLKEECLPQKKINTENKSIASKQSNTDLHD